MNVTRTVMRIAFIALAAAFFVGAASLYARSMRPQQRWSGSVTRRDAAPSMDSLPTFLRQCLVVAIITFVGRKVFRLRLADSSDKQAGPE